MTRTRLGLLPAAVIAVLMLAACVPAGSNSGSTPSPGAPADGTSAPTSAPTDDPVPQASDVVIEAERFAVLDDEGAVLLEFAWADDPTTIVADLEEVFGAAPETSLTPGDGSHFPDFDVYRWEGFSLSIARLGDRPRAEYFLPAGVMARTATVGDIRIRTNGGFGVGSTVSELLAAGVPVQEPAYEGGTLYRVDPSDPALVGSRAEPTRMVELISDAAEDRIVGLSAPALSFSPI